MTSANNTQHRVDDIGNGLLYRLFERGPVASVEDYVHHSTLVKLDLPTSVVAYTFFSRHHL